MKAIGKSFLIALVFILAACTREEFQELKSDITGQYKLDLNGEISGVVTTKVSDSGFADGDEVGIYVVDYDGSTPGSLLKEGNRADNVRYTFNVSNWSWTGAYDVYFKDKQTAVDIYGYYPFSSSAPDDVHKYAFEVAKDQSTSTSEAGLGGYESSDFLWGKATNIAPTTSKIKLGFGHIMACVRVSLVEGTGFADGEWATLDKSVVISGTKRKSTIDLATGVATVTGDVPSTGIVPVKDGSDFRAVVVPQQVAAGTNIMTVTVAGFSSVQKKVDAFTYVAGKQHNFTLTVNKKVSSGAYEVVLSNESITVWQPDEVSHDATAKGYVVINVDRPGSLDTCITKAGKDLAKVQNLKLTGKINSRDFGIMKYKMEKLSYLNLKDVEIVACAKDGDFENDPLGILHASSVYYAGADFEIPRSAFEDNKSLISVILPDKLIRIGSSAFPNTNLSGSLIIPEGVESIGKNAFQAPELKGNLYLPHTLKEIGDGAFYSCKFTCELQFPESIVSIGSQAFGGCSNLYGSLRLPKHLKSLGSAAFWDCSNLTGSLEIPQGIESIPGSCFSGTGLNGTLILHDGIKTIDRGAFFGTKFKGELRLPKNIEVIGANAFNSCTFSGNLVIPNDVISIGEGAFYYDNRLSGVLTIPDKCANVGANAFNGCSMLEGIILPECLETIGEGAFNKCFGIGSIICKGTMPARVLEGAFNGVPKDNFTLEVPESAIAQYQVSNGWKDFKRIAAYHNFVCRPNSATALNASTNRDLILNADGAWEVESKPDWVTLSQTSGNLKTALKLTFSEMPKGSATREGTVVFKLKDKDYRTKCSVSQYNYDYSEDQIVSLQTATKGDGVNIVILGDGYNAKDISEGKLMSDVKQTMEYYFAIQPYKAYREYFNVYTGIPVSSESGVGSVNTIISNRFNTTFTGGVGLGGRSSDGSDYVKILEYACKAPTVSQSNIGETLVIMVPNTSEYGGITYMYDDGSAIAYCPKSSDAYPFDWRGLVQHEAGGHGFGKLGDEYIYYNDFIDQPHIKEIKDAKSKGWFSNLELTGKMSNVGWNNLIFDSKYSGIVDIYEGGYYYSRGVFRSEENSCMNNNIPYYSTISREAMVKRIMMIAGEGYSFAKFKANDIIEASTSTKSVISSNYHIASTIYQHPPVMLGPRPKLR